MIRTVSLRTLVLPFALLLLCSAWARADHLGIPFEAGQPLASEIGPAGDTDTWVFSGMAGGFLSASVGRAKGSLLEPGVALFDPSGVAVDLTGLVKASEKKVALKKVPLPDTGLYALVISGENASIGGYVAKTKLKAGKIAPVTGAVIDPGGTLEIEFPGVALAKLSISIKKTDGTMPTVADLLDPTGAAMAGNWRDGLKASEKGAKLKAPLAGPFGIFALVLENPGGAACTVDYKLKVKFPKAPKVMVQASATEPVPIGVTDGPVLVGTWVTITGTDFLTGCEVYFGGQIATDMTFLTAMEVEALIPEVEGMVDVTVRNPDGQANTLAAALEVTIPPAAAILFPPSACLTDAGEIHVSGTAAHVTDLTLWVGATSFPVTTDDGFATWEAVVTLAEGANTLRVDVEDNQFQPQAGVATAEVERVDPIPAGLAGLSFDGAGGVYVCDWAREAIFQIDLATGARSIFSAVGHRGTGDALRYVRGVVLDGAFNRLLVSTAAPTKIYGVNLATGNRTVVSGVGVGSGDNFSAIGGIALDSGSSRLLVVDVNLDALIAVDLSTGDRTVLSDDSPEVGTGPGLPYPRDVCFDVVGNRAFITDDSADAVIEVDLATGNRTVLSDDSNGTGDQFVNPEGIDFDVAGNRLLVADLGLQAVIEVDLATGNRTVLSEVVPGVGYLMNRPKGVLVDAVNDRVLVTDEDQQSLFAVDLTSGARTGVSGAFIGTGSAVRDLRFARLDFPGNRVLVGDASLQAILSVDLTAGARSILSDSTTGNEDYFNSISGIEWDEAGGRILVMDTTGDTLFGVDPASGDRTVVSSSAVGAGPDIRFPQDTFLNVANDRLLFVDDTWNALMAIDLATGDRTEVSGPAVGTGFADFISPRGLDLDEDGSHAFVVDASLDALVMVDLSTGERTLVADNSTGTGFTFVVLRDVCLDATETSGLAVESNHRALFSIDLATGNRFVISGQTTGSGPVLVSPRKVELWPGGKSVLILDEGINALLVVHLASGDRVIITR